MVCQTLIIKGDTVLVKRDESKKKNDMAYITTPSIEFDMKGSIVIAEAQNASYKEHLIFQDGPDRCRLY